MKMYPPALKSSYEIKERMIWCLCMEGRRRSKMQDRENQKVALEGVITPLGASLLINIYIYIIWKVLFICLTYDLCYPELRNGLGRF